MVSATSELQDEDAQCPVLPGLHSDHHRKDTSACLPIDAYEPIEATLTAVNDAITFRINPIPIIPNTLKGFMGLNGQQVGDSSDVLQVEVSDFSPGINDIIVNIEDTTALLRVDNHNTIHFKSVHWEVNKKTSGTYDVKSRLNEYEILIYPNPAHDKIHVRIDQHIDIPIELQLTDMDGTIINRADVRPGKRRLLRSVIQHQDYISSGFIIKLLHRPPENHH